MFFSKNAPLFKMVFGHAGHAGHAASHETDEARITFKYLHPVTQDYVRIWVPVPTFKSAGLRPQQNRGATPTLSAGMFFSKYAPLFKILFGPCSSHEIDEALAIIQVPSPQIS